jgi:dimethylglycine dehydrogenase
MVSGLQAHADGSWTVVTEKGSIVAEHVVNAGGLWAREVGRMVGVELPVVPMEHHYLLTDELHEIKNAGRELPLVLDLDGEIYLRQEQNGVQKSNVARSATRDCGLICPIIASMSLKCTVSPGATVTAGARALSQLRCWCSR